MPAYSKYLVVSLPISDPNRAVTPAQLGYERDGLDVPCTSDKVTADKWVRETCIHTAANGVKGWRKQYGNTLRRMLKDVAVLKVGEGIDQDVERLRRAGVEINGAVELRTLLDIYQREDPANATTTHRLKVVSHHYLGIAIKPDFTSVWGRTAPLDDISIEYAALDAFASLEVFRVVYNRVSVPGRAEWEQTARAHIAANRA
ncbi:hypothetical protein HDV00_001609 [Rhizophlyctis rosea]|nr:hypothetical protein HDV00_001609 [Rhizophlyctis rosea]